MTPRLIIKRAVRVLMLPLIAASAAGCRPTPAPEPTPRPTAPPTAEPEEVVLTLGSWRPDDVEQMHRLLKRFHDEHPTITIQFEGIHAPDYNNVLQAQLASGSAPDLFYVRSYATSRAQYDEGYLEPLDSLPELQAAFPSEMVAPWATEDGLPYAVPFIATSHGIYYNEELFATLDVSIPETWEELLTTAATIKDTGITPFANTSGDSWTIAELVFMNLAPGFIGGREGREAYLHGDRCFDDERMVAAFRAVGDLAPFLPPNHELLTYADSRELFVQGQAAMFMGGSWDIAFFEASNPAFAWSVFATPPPAGRAAHVTFHPDAGIALNAACTRKEEALTFLSWMTTSACSDALANELPGFFPMHRERPTIENDHARAFLALNEGRGTDARLAWERLREGSPDGYALMEEGAVGVLRGEQTPREAAEGLQSGLAEWFGPAQTCEE